MKKVRTGSPAAVANMQRGDVIVEFDRALLDTYCAYFERAGLETATATSGAAAIKHYLEGNFNTVLLEPDLPESSCEFLHAVASRTDRLPLPVVIVSRRSHFDLPHPVHSYHVKPVSMSTLLDSVRNAARQM